MTVYTLFLYIALAGLGLWATLGMGHAKLKDYQRTYPIQWYLQYFMGALFLFSGFVKAVDPLGTAYKMKDYFTQFAVQGLPFMDFFKTYVLEVSVLMLVFELVLGFCLVLGIGERKTTWSSFLLLIFFTLLTGFNYLTGFTPKGVAIYQFSGWTSFDPLNIRITDCGCFGDFMKISPTETFVKDIILTAGMIPLILKAFRLKTMIPSTKVWRNSAVALLTLVSTWFCFQNFYFAEPMIDFRPFAVGVNIKAAKEECAKNAPVIETELCYRHKTKGDLVYFSANDMMKEENQVYWKDTENWENLPDNRRDRLIKEGCTSNIRDVNYPEVEESKGYALWVIAADLDATHLDNFKKIVELSQTARGKEIPTYGTYFNIKDANGDGSSADELEAFKQKTGTTFDWAQMDEKPALTIARGNPALLLLKDGTIIAKWHHRQLPSAEQLKAMLN